MTVVKLNSQLNQAISILKLSSNRNCIIRNGKQEIFNPSWNYCWIYPIINWIFFQWSYNPLWSPLMQPIQYNIRYSSIKPQYQNSPNLPKRWQIKSFYFHFPDLKFYRISPTTTEYAGSLFQLNSPWYWVSWMILLQKLYLLLLPEYLRNKITHFSPMQSYALLQTF